MTSAIDGNGKDVYDNVKTLIDGLDSGKYNNANFEKKLNDDYWDGLTIKYTGEELDFTMEVDAEKLIGLDDRMISVTDGHGQDLYKSVKDLMSETRSDGSPLYTNEALLEKLSNDYYELTITYKKHVNIVVPKVETMEVGKQLNVNVENVLYECEIEKVNDDETFDIKYIDADSVPEQTKHFNLEDFRANTIDATYNGKDVSQEVTELIRTNNSASLAAALEDKYDGDLKIKFLKPHMQILKELDTYIKESTLEEMRLRAFDEATNMLSGELYDSKHAYAPFSHDMRSGMRSGIRDLDEFLATDMGNFEVPDAGSLREFAYDEFTDLRGSSPFDCEPLLELKSEEIVGWAERRIDGIMGNPSHVNHDLYKERLNNEDMSRDYPNLEAYLRNKWPGLFDERRRLSCRDRAAYKRMQQLLDLIEGKRME